MTLRQKNFASQPATWLRCAFLRDILLGISGFFGFYFWFLRAFSVSARGFFPRSAMLQEKRSNPGKIVFCLLYDPSISIWDAFQRKMALFSIWSGDPTKMRRNLVPIDSTKCFLGYHQGFCFVFTKAAKYRSQAANFCKSMSYSTDLDTFSGHPQANYLNFKAKLRRNLPFARLKKKTLMMQHLLAQNVNLSSRTST